MEETELVLKFPERKPPFMGVLFEREFTASRVNQTWVNNYKDFTYKIMMEPQGDCLRLSIYCEKLPNKYTYLVDRYDKGKVKEFLQKASGVPINFGHVVKYDEQLKYVRTSVCNEVWVLKVDKVEYYDEY